MPIVAVYVTNLFVLGDQGSSKQPTPSPKEQHPMDNAVPPSQLSRPGIGKGSEKDTHTDM